MTVGALFGCCKPEGVTVITRVPHGKVRVKRRYIRGLTSDPSPPERPAEREPRDPGRQLIRLTKHAEEAVEKRRLEMQWIEKTVLEPDFSDTDPNDQR